MASLEKFRQVMSTTWNTQKWQNACQNCYRLLPFLVIDRRCNYLVTLFQTRYSQKPQIFCWNFSAICYSSRDVHFTCFGSQSLSKLLANTLWSSPCYKASLSPNCRSFIGINISGLLLGACHCTICHGPGHFPDRSWTHCVPSPLFQQMP